MMEELIDTAEVSVLVLFDSLYYLMLALVRELTHL